MWRLRLIFMKRFTRTDLPHWPSIYYSGGGRVVVTAVHATLLRYVVLDKTIGILMRPLLIGIAVLGCCMLTETGKLNSLQRLRVGIDQAIIRCLPASLVPYVVEESWLNAWMWMGIFFIVLIGCVLLRYLNRPLLAGWLFGRRTTVHFSSKMITRWWTIIPLRMRRNATTKIEFRATDDPKQKSTLIAPHWLSLHVEMIFGERRILLARVLGLKQAEQFAICCKAALALADELSKKRERDRVHQNTLRGVGALE